MRFLHAALVAGMATGWALVAACSGESTTPHSTLCSSVPYDASTFPPTRPPSANASSLPECTPRCGAVMIEKPPFYPEYAVSDLPSGPCQYDRDACVLTAGTTQQCGEKIETCNQSEFECHCEGGMWRCYVTSQGAAICLPSCDVGSPDGSIADAAPDGQAIPHDPSCATGPATQQLPPRRAQSSQAELASLPTCAPRCGATKVAGQSFDDEYAMSDLPSGACRYDGDHCQIDAALQIQTCGTETHACDFSGFECYCERSQWQCYSTSQGAGACLGAANPDGGFP